ncbi:MAG: 30S ribosomal protein S4 [Candidatus Pacebacteria bacterium]|jgi:small subunit ribosomal protein S4|nr:30S ribosomal protein S4 [Candidatus Paceibacterota bacterium]
MKIGPKYKICRRLGAQVFEKCQTPKFVAAESNKKGGKGKRGKAATNFAIQLLEKQKVRFSYGVSEKQFYNYVKKALVVKKGAPTEKLSESLERRLDNVVYRLGLANSRALARQMVAHGHFVVKGKRVTVPSYNTSVGDVISIREGSRSKALFQNLDTRLKNYTSPNWLSFDIAKGEAVVKALPNQPESYLDYNAVIEFYSR